MKPATASITEYQPDSVEIAKDQSLSFVGSVGQVDWQDKLALADIKLREGATTLVTGSARFAIALVYVWFGVLKVFWLSPAMPLVEKLHAQTVSFIPFHLFFPAFGLLEVAIGVMFLFPKISRFALIAMFLHLVTTMAPLVLLPNMVWTGTLVPTLEGQYIIKNVLLMALGVVLLSQLKPLSPRIRLS